MGIKIEFSPGWIGIINRDGCRQETHQYLLYKVSQFNSEPETCKYRESLKSLFKALYEVSVID